MMPITKKTSIIANSWLYERKKLAAVGKQRNSTTTLYYGTQCAGTLCATRNRTNTKNALKKPTRLDP